MNRTGLKSAIGGNSGKAVDCIGALIKEGWLHEITVPPQERTNSKRSAFLIALDKPEHDAWVIESVLPEKKQVIPPSWKKSASQGIVGVLSSPSNEPEKTTAQESQQEVLIPSVPIPSVP